MVFILCAGMCSKTDLYKQRRMWILPALFVFGVVFFLAGCGRTYQGIHLENREQVVEDLRSAMKNRSYQLRIFYTAGTALTEEQIGDLVADLVEAAYYESADPVGGDYLRWQQGGFEYQYTVTKWMFRRQYEICIRPLYYTDAGQEEETDRMVAEVLEGLDAAEDVSMTKRPETLTEPDISEKIMAVDVTRSSKEISDEQKVRAVHDYICQNVTYDTVHKHMTGSTHIQSTAYAALHYHTALCQGYTVLAYRLLKELGIDNRIVSGMTVVNGEPEWHVWNIVRIGEKYYNMDVTLDAVKSHENKDMVPDAAKERGEVNTVDRSRYLRSDESFDPDHTRDEVYDTEEFHAAYPMSGDDFFPKK